MVNEIARIAFSKMPDFARVEKGALVIVDTNQLTEDQQAAISEISETTGEGGRTVRVKLHDKLAALDKLAKGLSLYKERHEVSGPNGGPVQIEDSVAQLEAMVEGIARRKAAELPVVAELQPPPMRIAAPIRQPVRVIDAD